MDGTNPPTTKAERLRLLKKISDNSDNKDNRNNNEVVADIARVVVYLFAVLVIPVA